MENYSFQFCSSSENNQKIKQKREFHLGERAKFNPEPRAHRSKESKVKDDKFSTKSKLLKVHQRLFLNKLINLSFRIDDCCLPSPFHPVPNIVTSRGHLTSTTTTVNIPNFPDRDQCYPMELSFLR